jgi:hypothetical protein
MEEGKKVKVVETYFREDTTDGMEKFLLAVPDFLLEDGRVKKARVINGILFWATDDEMSWDLPQKLKVKFSFKNLFKKRK